MTMQASDIIRKVRRIDIITSRKVAESLAGGYHSVFKGRGVEFAEVRPYQPGDDVRTIDWNVTARTGELFTKNFTEERELNVNLLVDASGSLGFGGARTKREYTTEIAALLAYSAIANGDRVGLMLFTDRVEKILPPRKGRRHALRIIRELLGYEPAARGTDLGAAMQTLNRLATRRSVTFLVSDFLHGMDGFSRAARIAVRRHDIIPVVVRDPLEHMLPPAGLVRVADAESGATAWIDAGNREARAAFARMTAAEEDRLTASLRELRMSPLFLRNGEDAVRPLVRYFALRKGRKR